MERRLDVSEAVYQALVARITDFTDTPDAVLRRLLGIDAGLTLDADGKLSVSLTRFPCVDRRDEHDTEGTGACVHCGFKDAVCVGRKTDWDGDWYDCGETAEWMGIADKIRGPEPFCGFCIEGVTVISPRHNRSASTPEWHGDILQPCIDGGVEP